MAWMRSFIAWAGRDAQRQLTTMPASLDHSAAAQTSQQEKLNLSPAKEQAVTQGLANQSAHSPHDC